VHQSPACHYVSPFSPSILTLSFLVVAVWPPPSSDASDLLQLNAAPESVVPEEAPASKPDVSIKSEKKKKLKTESAAAKSSEESKLEDGGNDDIATSVDVSKPSVGQRTLCISGISEDVAYKQLLRKVRKFGRIEALMYPAAEGTDVAYILYHGADQAAAALTKLSSGFSIGTKTATVQFFSTSRVNRYRVIVRNLPFKCTEEMLREHFAPFGEILQIDLPAGTTPGTIRGFGFITYTSLQAANKATINGSQLKIAGRKIAVDLTVGRDQLIKNKDGKLTGIQPSQSSSSMDVDGDRSDNSQGGNDEDHGEEDKNGDDPGKEDDDEEDGVDEKEKTPDEDDEEAWPKEMPSFESEDDSNEEEEKVKEAEKKKAFSSDVHLGQTLFLRNVAFDTSESELFDKFSEWGPLKHAKLVVDRQTGEARGTAFVHFVNADDAQKCLKDAYRSKKFANHRKQPRKKKEEGDMQESDIQIGGRNLIVDVAVTRKSADKLTEERSAQRERAKADPRNLTLAALSTLTQDQMAELTKEEREKYEKGQHEKKMKLANPNFHVSRTRLCVRNLPKTMTEDALRSLFASAAKSVPGHMGFHQVKIVRDKERGDASRGYGFVEFGDHVHARAALEHINGKHQQLAKNYRLFVEFAVEDSRVLQAREFRLVRSKENSRKVQAMRDAQKEDGGAADAETKKRRQKNPKKRKRDEEEDQPGGGSDAAGAKTKRPERAPKRSKDDERPAKKPKFQENNAPSSSATTTPRDKRRSATDSYNAKQVAFTSVKKGEWGMPSESSRRGARSVSQRKQEEALQKMIGEYQKSLDSEPKKRWFD